jgi:hypothetical protein
MNWRLTILAVLAVLALAGCGLTNPDPDEMKEVVGRVTGAMEQQARSVQQTKPVGETLTLPAGETLTLNRVASELPGVTAPEGKRLLVLEVSLANPGGEKLALNPTEDFAVTDITGRRYQPFTVQGLPSDGLAAGAKAQGSLAFALEPDARDLRFGWQMSPMTVFALG